MTMLLAIRVLPHHHHTLHIPGTLATVEYMHLGAECCDCDGSHTHDDSCECPGEKTLYYTAPCDDLDTYKPMRFSIVGQKMSDVGGVLAKVRKRLLNSAAQLMPPFTTFY